MPTLVVAHEAWAREQCPSGQEIQNVNACLAAASLPGEPFPDEPFSRRVEVVAYRQAWAGEGAQLAADLRELLPGAVSVDHVGSTAVPGLPAQGPPGCDGAGGRPG